LPGPRTTVNVLPGLSRPPEPALLILVSEKVALSVRTGQAHK
jgi:hypothetical protein